MVGMCGGLPENKADDNSVIIARQIFNYEPQRLKENMNCFKPSIYRCLPVINNLVNGLQSEGSFGDINVHFKDYASGEKLIDDLKSKLRGKIIDMSNDIVGVEMEGHGLFHALWEYQIHQNIPVTLIKGVSDFCDGTLNENKAQRQKNATQQALLVAITILENWDWD